MEYWAQHSLVLVERSALRLRGQEPLYGARTGAASLVAAGHLAVRSSERLLGHGWAITTSSCLSIFDHL
jgi:hypothetical protein